MARIITRTVKGGSSGDEKKKSKPSAAINKSRKKK